MPRKLKTYQTSLGFYDQAIAAPSMKAALEAWGANSNLFHQGAAKETDDPKIVAATRAKPGVVLRRPVGSDGPFGVDAELPRDLGISEADDVNNKPDRRRAPKSTGRSLGDAARSKAERAYEEQQKARQYRQAEEEAKRQARRQRLADRAQAALYAAERRHAERSTLLRSEADALEKRSRAEESRWEKEKARLTSALTKTRA